jgi:hypothetical protein
MIEDRKLALDREASTARWKASARRPAPKSAFKAARRTRVVGGRR